MKILKVIGYAVIIILIVIQFIPVERTNPPVSYQVKWPDGRTKELFGKACMDCHSNETKWPWYSYVAPFSTLISHDVSEGRSKFNISNGNLKEADEAAASVRKGSMPLKGYLRMHPEAKLNDKDKRTLIEGLILTFGEDKEKNDKD